MKDFLLIIDTEHSVFKPQTEAAQAYLKHYSLPDPWCVETHEFTLPAHMTHIEVTGKLTLEVQDERGKSST